MGGVQTRARWNLRLVALDRIGEVCAVPRALANFLCRKFSLVMAVALPLPPLSQLSSFADC
eukprot:COSAG02_NODE_2049_length_10007_cov_226.930057_6_plen_61_part_00